MADVVDKATRSRMMAGIRGKDTQPEIAIRRALFAAGFRYRLHGRKLPGRPDLVFPKHRAVIFINGCFWHGHDCHLYREPGSNREFWATKIESNRARDRRVARQLADQGWRVLVIWECSFRGAQKAKALQSVSERAARWLTSRSHHETIRGTQ